LEKKKWNAERKMDGESERREEMVVGQEELLHGSSEDGRSSVWT